MATQNTINLVLADDMIYFALICCLDRGYFYQFAFLGKLLEGGKNCVFLIVAHISSVPEVVLF